MPILSESQKLCKNNCTAILKSPRKNTSVPEIGSAETPANATSATLLFSKQLATKINPKQPDINAATILYGLHLWQKKRISFEYEPTVNGLRGCYQSLSQLQATYPWLSEEGIRKALDRAQTALKGAFIVDRTNAEAARGKLHFWLSPSLIKKYKFSADKKGLLQMQADHAVQYVVLEAILISNLEYITAPKRSKAPVKDGQGKIYRELSPTVLTASRITKDGTTESILPRSRKAVTQAIAHLKALGVFIEHPSKPGFYRLKNDSDNVTEVAGGVSEVASRVSEVAGAVTEVARQTVPMPHNSLNTSVLECKSETPYTNTSTNAYSNADTKCLLTDTASLRSPVSVLSSAPSSGATKLMELVAHDLIRHKQKLASSRHKIVYDGDEFCEASSLEHSDTGLAITTNYLPEHELHYDAVTIDDNTGKPYKRSVEIDYIIDELKQGFRYFDFPYTAKDIARLRQVFVDHPKFHLDHFRELKALMLHAKHNIFGGKLKPHTKGHDYFYWAKRITNLGQMLNYLPQLIREHHIAELWMSGPNDAKYHVEANGKLAFDYSEMREPFLSLAFQGDTTTPVTFDDSEHFYDRSKPLRPVYCAEFVGLPTIEVVEHEINPLAVTS